MKKFSVLPKAHEILTKIEKFGKKLQLKQKCKMFEKSLAKFKKLQIKLQFESQFVM